MTIDEIYRNNKISVRSYNVCKNNDLNSIFDIKKFYSKHRTFYDLQSCGRKSNEELIKICSSFQDTLFDFEEAEDKRANPKRTTIDEIYRNNKISVRSYNVCKYNDLNSISDLNKFYSKHRTFYDLQNCGRKSNEELIKICHAFIGSEFENEEKIEQPVKKAITALSIIQREIINNFILFYTNSLSVRSKNCITLYLDDNFKIENFAEEIFLSKHFKVSKIRNIGSKSISELELYISTIRDLLFEISGNENEKELVDIKKRQLFQQNFSITEIPMELIETESIFLLTDYLLNNNLIFDKIQTEIVKKRLKIYQDSKVYTLEDIGLEVNLTRERIRQISQTLIKSLYDKLLLLQNFNDDLLQKYSIDTNINQIRVNNKNVEAINNINSTNFSREFITYILYSYLFDEFLLVGNIEDILESKNYISRNRHFWNNVCLVKKEIITEFDFNALADDISNRLSDRIEETYSFHFKSYLSRFLLNNNLDILEIVIPIAENIIFEEFEIHLDLDSNIHFERNTNKLTYEYAAAALDKLKKPSTVKEIYAEIAKQHPDYDTQEAKVRISMKRENGFVPIGRSSIFGLKKWEDKLRNFQGGTIREIVVGFLEATNEPKHISDIAKHVLIYRPESNKNSILQNIKAANYGIFVFYPHSTIGLKNKEPLYSKQIQNANKIDNKNFSKSIPKYAIDDLYNFIKKHSRMPDYRDPKERNLYQFYYRNKSRFEKNKTLTFKEKQLIELIEKYGTSNRSSKYTIDDLYNFIIENQRMPDSRDPNERNLYQFYYRNKSSFEKNKTLTFKEWQLNELIKKFSATIRNSKYTIDDLCDFISNNKRMPDSRDPNERNLYQFYYRNISNLDENTASSFKEKQLIELKEEYGTSKRSSKYTIEDLYVFFIEEQRMPDSRNPIERSLYYYYYRVKRLFDKNELEEKDEKLFIDVLKVSNNYNNKKLISRSEKWESQLLFWSKNKQEGYTYSTKKDAWWKKK